MSSAIFYFSVVVGILYPLDVASVLPNSNLSRAVYFDECAATVLLAVEPLAVIDTPILPLEDAGALALIVDEMTLVLLAIGPFKQATSVHFVLLPLTIICLAIWPHILSVSANLVLEECSGVDATVSKGKSSLSILLTILVGAIVAGTIRPGFNALPMLLVLEPVTHIGGTIGVPVSTVAVSLVIEPHALVDIAIGMHQSSHSVGLVVLPHSFVARRVRPDLDTTSMFLAKDALASVCAAIGVGGETHTIDLVIGLVASCRDTAHALTHKLLAFLTATELPLLLRLLTILDLKFLPLLVDVRHVTTVGCIGGAFAFLLLDCDLTFVVGVVCHAVSCAISHLFFVSGLKANQ